MIGRTTKWYRNKWFYIIIQILIIVGAYFLLTKSRVYLNYQHLKTEIKELEKELSSKDSLYKIKEAEKEKVKVIREKISIQSELDRLEHLKNQLIELRKQPPKQIDTLSPEELDKYLKNLLK